jgi:hypothetical protein
MAKFLQGDHLNSELIKVFERAEDQLVIISPFIKLHQRIKDCLKNKQTEPKLKITVVFGKNEDNMSKSLGKEEFEFLSKFPNIEIKYEPRLHAKYYANESSAILSSMNLYEYSQNNNIEFGILTKATILGELASNVIGESLDKDAFGYFGSVMDNSETKFKKTPQFDQKLMGLSKKYSHSEIEVDTLSSQLDSKTNIKRKSTPNKSTNGAVGGYCIRTGVKITFNPKRPMSDKAYKSWSKYGDENYSEKYCHFSGEKSDGETSFGKPIMRKNWKKSQK